MYGDDKKSLIIAETATFVALIAIGGWISIPFIPVPITLQTMFVLLSGAVMKRYAVIPAALYMVLGALNLPVFHNGLAGIGVLFGPTGGYIIGFVAAAAIVGFSYENKSGVLHIIGIIAGTAAIYCLGAGWLICSTGMPFIDGILVGVAPFLVGDVLKGAATYIIAGRLE